MQSHRLNFESLFEGYLANDQQAIDSLVMHIRQGELTQQENDTMLLRLDAEVKKTDDSCNANALALRGFLYANTQCPDNREQAIALFKRAIALGNANAMTNRANLHVESKGDPVDYPTAIALYEQAIELGNADAMTNRATLHVKGRGGPVDYPTAIVLYGRAIELGNADAMTNRATMHMYGQGSPINYPAAIELFEQAIKSRNASAMFYRATMHVQGQGGPVNYPATIALFERAIMLGNTYAMTNRAAMYVASKGGPVNYPAAIALYGRVIKLGDVIAMINRAIMHENGLGGQIEHTDAARLYRQAAKRGGNVDAALTRLLGKTHDIYTRYHIHMSRKKPGILPDEIVAMFKLNPDGVISFFYNDDLLNEQEKQEIDEFIGDYYIKLASSKLAEIDINDATGVNVLLSLLGKVPKTSSQANQALLMQADYLFNAAIGNQVSPEDLPYTLQRIDELHRKISNKDHHSIAALCEKLQDELISSNMDNPLIQDKLASLLSIRNKSIEIMAYAGSISTLKLNVEKIGWQDDIFDVKKHLLIYVSRRKVIDSYAEQIKVCLQVIREKLIQFQEQNTSLTLWNKALSVNLQDISRELSSKLLLNTTKEVKVVKVIQLAAQVCKTLKAGSLQSTHKEEAEFCKQALGIVQSHSVALEESSRKKNEIMNDH